MSNTPFDLAPAAPSFSFCCRYFEKLGSAYVQPMEIVSFNDCGYDPTMTEIVLRSGVTVLVDCSMSDVQAMLQRRGLIEFGADS